LESRILGKTPRMRLQFFSIAFLIAAGLLASCGNEEALTPHDLGPGAAPGVAASPSPQPTGSLVCTQVYVYGIVIHVTDPSGNPITNAHAVIQDGSYNETLEPTNAPATSGVYQGAGERPGTYRLTVSAPGYQPVTLENLVVTSGVCHVTPVEREVVLEP
jgi:hypothetical protein